MGWGKGERWERGTLRPIMPRQAIEGIAVAMVSSVKLCWSFGCGGVVGCEIPRN